LKVTRIKLDKIRRTVQSPFESNARYLVLVVVVVVEL
jgi:hypothetical protein